MSQHEPEDPTQPIGPPIGQPGDLPRYDTAAYTAPGAAQQPWPTAAMSPSDENTWVAIGHFGGLLIGLFAPLGVLLFKGKESARVRAQAYEALNFQLSMTIYAIVSIPLAFILIGFVTLLGVSIALVVCSIIAGVKALNGEDYRYPLTIRMIS